MTDAKKADKVRVYALAKEAGLTSKEMLSHLQDQGIEVKSIQSTVLRDDADKALKALKPAKKSTKKAAAKKTTAKKTTTKKAAAKKSTKKADDEEEEKPKAKKSTKKAAAKKTTTKKAASKKSTKKADDEEEKPKAKKSTKKTTKAKPKAKKTKKPEGPWYEGHTTAHSFAETYMRGALATFGLEAEVEVQEVEDNDPELHIKAEGLRELSGQKTIINQLAYLLGKAIHYKFDEDIRYALRVDRGEASDSDDAPAKEASSAGDEAPESAPKARKSTPANEPLEKLAITLAERMNDVGKVLLIDALNSQERRSIHTAIADGPFDGAKTISDGDGIFRRLMIAPASMAAPSNGSSRGDRRDRDDRPPRSRDDNDGDRGERRRDDDRGNERRRYDDRGSRRRNDDRGNDRRRSRR